MISEGNRGAQRFALPVAPPVGGFSPTNSRSTVIFVPRSSYKYTLPSTFIDSTYNQSSTVTSFARDTLLVDSGNPDTNRVNLQAEIDICKDIIGHTRIRLPANWLNSGPIILRVHADSGSWTYIEWDDKDTVSAGEGFRCITSQMTNAPRMIGNGFGNGAVWCDMSADRYRFTSIRFQKDNYAVNYRLIAFSGFIGSDENSQTTLEQCPTHMFLDRCWLDGENTGRNQNGVVFNCKYFAMVDCVANGMWADGFESHAVLSHNSPGPWKIVGCELESSAINFIIGGLNPLIPGLKTIDGEFRRNFVHKRVSWNKNDPVNFDGHIDPNTGLPSSRFVKNLWELKWGDNILVEGNIFRFNWSGLQQGAAIVIKTENGVENGAPGGSLTNTTKNIVFRDNIIEESSGAIEFIGRGFGGALDEHTSRVELSNNLFKEIAKDIYANATDSGASPGGLMFSEGVNHVYLRNNTFSITDGAKTRWGRGWQHIYQDGYLQPALEFENNIFDIAVPAGGSGTIYGSGFPTALAHGTGVLEGFTGNNYIFAKNLLVGALNDGGVYPANNLYPFLSSDILFVDKANGNYRLQVTSPGHNYGLDGNDIGVNQDDLELATQNVITGL